MKIVLEKGENSLKITETLETLYYCWFNTCEPNPARPKPSRAAYKKAKALLDKIQDAVVRAQ
jgi:hypothetical protein